MSSAGPEAAASMPSPMLPTQSTPQLDKPMSSGGMKLGSNKPSPSPLPFEDDEGGWGDLEEPTSIPSIPEMHASNTSVSAPTRQAGSAPAAPSLQPIKPTNTGSMARPGLGAPSPALNRANTTNNAPTESHISVQKSHSLHTLSPSPSSPSTPLSKEEKAQDLARKREERAQKIAQIKAAKAAATANTGTLI